ncbi:MAG: hypothetical protein PHZ09_05700 [Eubacteriales bacterium]|jgi:hypothetical protein|nr:hypothetical protein [Eubacteriales bacterium]
MRPIFLRTVSSILATLLFIAACACSDPLNTAAHVTSAEITGPAAETETERSQISDSLPEDLDFGGENIVIYLHDGQAQPPFLMGPEEQTGEIVDDAILQRNLSVMERLNIVFEYDPIAGDLATAANNIRKFVSAGDDVYDLVSAPQYSMVSLATSGCFANALTLDYLDFDMPWWWTDYMNELSIGYDTRFYLVGDYFLNMLLGTRILYFNKNLYADYWGGSDELYDLVLTGSWTLEKMKILIDAVYTDLNGNSEVDTDDQFGFVTYGPYSSTDPFAFGTDVRLTKRDENGMVELFIDGNEKAADLLPKLLDIFWCDGSWIYDPGKSDDTINGLKFIAGEALFLGNSSFVDASRLRDMEDDFGVLPYPKYDETQEQYRSFVQDSYNLGIIPVTGGSLGILGAVLEALSAETYRSVINAYYETALKIKYARDDMSSMVIDIVHDSVNTEFAFAYYSILGSAGSIYRELISSKKADFASTAAKASQSAEKALEKLIAAYEEG